MSMIFISHSSQDKATAEDMKKRLEEKGYHLPFLASDHQSGIPAGAKWEQILYDRLGDCQALSEML